MGQAIKRGLLKKRDLHRLGTLSGDDGSELMRRNIANSAKLEWPVHISIDEPLE